MMVYLTHWGWVTHICVGKLTIIGSGNGLSPGRRQAIIWANAGILLIRRLGTNFSEILIEIHTFSFKKMHLKMSSGKWRPFCLGLNVLTDAYIYIYVSLGLDEFTHWDIGVRQDGRHFVDDIFKCIFVNDNHVVGFNFHWNMSPRVQLPIIHHCFK